MYQKVDTNLNFVDREKQVEKFWKENHIFEKSMEDRKDDPTYMFYDGRQTAYRSCTDPCYQRYDPEIPYYERLHGTS